MSTIMRDVTERRRVERREKNAALAASVGVLRTTHDHHDLLNSILPA